MICYKVSHKYKLIDHFEYKAIGIYSSLDNANAAIELLRTKNGFKETVEGVKVKKVFKFFQPRLLDKTFWVEGFDTYTY